VWVGVWHARGVGVRIMFPEGGTRKTSSVGTTSGLMSTTTSLWGSGRDITHTSQMRHITNRKGFRKRPMQGGWLEAHTRGWAQGSREGVGRRPLASPFLALHRNATPLNRAGISPHKTGTSITSYTGLNHAHLERVWGNPYCGSMGHPDSPFYDLMGELGAPFHYEAYTK
jgi:hypothetical protein